jgi:hypothetical protein
MGLLSFACRMADYAYAPADRAALTTQLRDIMGLTLLDVVYDQDTGYRVLICEDPAGGIHIAFPGTKDASDLLADLEAIQVGSDLFHPTERIHAGFLARYLSVREGMMECLMERQVTRVRIYGHSLGGGVTTLAAHDLASLGVVVSAVTFGSPRVGNHAFAASYDAAVPDTVRIVHHIDPIPTVPDLCYEHVAGELHLRDDGTVVGTVKCWWRRLLGWDRQLLADIDGVGLRNHYLTGYQGAVDRFELRQA